MSQWSRATTLLFMGTSTVCRTPWCSKSWKSAPLRPLWRSSTKPELGAKHRSAHCPVVRTNPERETPPEDGGIVRASESSAGRSSTQRNAWRPLRNERCSPRRAASPRVLGVPAVGAQRRGLTRIPRSEHSPAKKWDHCSARRLRRGPHLDDCARLNSSQRLGAGREVRL